MMPEKSLALPVSRMFFAILPTPFSKHLRGVAGGPIVSFRSRNGHFNPVLSPASQCRNQPSDSATPWRRIPIASLKGDGFPNATGHVALRDRRGYHLASPGGWPSGGATQCCAIPRRMGMAGEFPGPRQADRPKSRGLGNGPCRVWALMERPPVSETHAIFRNAFSPLACGGHPLLRRQADAKCFALYTPPRSAWRGRPVQPAPREAALLFVQTTRSGGPVSFTNTASRLSSALYPIARRVSTVALPMCGSSVTFSSVR